MANKPTSTDDLPFSLAEPAEDIQPPPSADQLPWCPIAVEPAPWEEDDDSLF